VPVQADVGQERGGVAGDLFGDRFDDKTGQCPFQGRPVDAGGWTTSTRVAAEVMTRRSSARARASHAVTVRSR
jgi:hypothetical protein